jgi:hypothetical protein
VLKTASVVNQRMVPSKLLTLDFFLSQNSLFAFSPHPRFLVVNPLRSLIVLSPPAMTAQPPQKQLQIILPPKH